MAVMAQPYHHLEVHGIVGHDCMFLNHFDIQRLTMDSSHSQFMAAAIEEARAGLAEGGIPIGAVLVKDGRIIGRGHNRRVQQQDPVLHAEIDCLRSAGRIGSYRDTILYSTLMPCHLCAGAAVQFRIPTVVVGESRNFEGARLFLEEHGIRVLDLDLPACTRMLRAYIEEHPRVWNEDIGEE
jgi:cytosine deaminase